MRRTGKQRGVTLLGLILALAMGLVVIAAGFAIFSAQMRAQSTMRAQTGVMQDVRLVADPVVRELRMTGFGVDAGEAIVRAGDHEIEFYGDIDDDVREALAEPASQGDTSIKVHLNDSEPSIGRDDLIFLDGTRREAVKVLQTGEYVDTTGEPDTIRLGAPLAYDHAANTTTVHTIEKVHYTYSADDRTLLRNGDVVSFDVGDLTFRYYDAAGQELAVGAGGLVAVGDLSSIRRFAAHLSIETIGGGRLVDKEFDVAVDLRNQGFLHYRNDHCPPEPPTSAVVTDDETCRHFQVRWSSPTENACDGSEADDLEGFRIYFGTSSGVYFRPSFTVWDADVHETWVEDRRLEQGETYYVAVAAVDSSFNESLVSTETTFTLDDDEGPDPPAVVTAVSGAESVTIGWDAADARDVRGYRVYRGDSADFTPGDGNRVADETTLKDDAREFTDTGLTPCVTYYYYVTAVDCAQEGELSELIYGDGDGPDTDQPETHTTDTTPEETTPAPPAAPNPLVASAGDGEVEVTWVAPADDDLERVVIRVSTSGYPDDPDDGDELVDVASAPGAAGSQTHSDLINGFTYYYSAFAIDLCGNISEAAQASATPTSSNGPHVRVVRPYAGQTIRDGELEVWAQAYDERAAGISDPPDWFADDGKGIQSVEFDSGPTRLKDFPHTENTTLFCGFGNEGSNSCDTGDVAPMCPGNYYVWAVATGMNDDTATSDLVHFYLDTGGLSLDASYPPRTTGSTGEEVRFRIETTEEDLWLRIETVTISWDAADARLVGYGNQSSPWQFDYRWNASLPVASGTLFDAPGWYKLWPGDTFEERLHFVYPYSKTRSKMKTGWTSVRLYDVTGFAVGDTVYFADQASYPRTITAINGDTITVDSGLPFWVSKNDTVSKWPDVDAIDMSGVTVTMDYAYTKQNGSAECSLELEVEVGAGTHAGTVYQDKPQVDTVALAIPGQIRVVNDDDVPVHVEVEDWTGSGIDSVRLYSKRDNAMSSEAPANGYSQQSMAYDSTDARYEATISGRSDTRIWYYLVVTGGDDEQARLPETGAYTYDHEAIDPPDCPSNLTAQGVGRNKVDLSWQDDAGGSVESYNVYRKDGCGEFALLVGGVTDQQNAAGIQYRDQGTDLDLHDNCYTYYVTAVDLFGNESAGCETNTATVGDECPADCDGGGDDDDDDGDYFYVVDQDREKVYIYTQAGQHHGVIPMDHSNSDATGAATDDDHVYVVDAADKKVYRYNRHGSPRAGVSRTLGTYYGGSLYDVEGLALDGDDLWVLDRSGYRIYRYSLSDAFDRGGTLYPEASVQMSYYNSDARGLAVDQDTLYVADEYSQRIYLYAVDGPRWDLSRTMEHPNGSDVEKTRGLKVANGAAWVVDADDDVVVKFDLDDLFEGDWYHESPLKALLEFDLNNSQREPEGL